MKVSFIIPVYKVERYLDICIQSILRQTFSDYEILLVDDGSPDRCPQICDEWGTKDDRIKVFHKSNGGLSDTRNFGLLHAQGEYVVFLDSDDFWSHKNDLQKLINVIDKYPEADFIGFNCMYYYEKSDSFSKWPGYSDALASPIESDIAIISLIQSGTFPMSACLKLLRRDTLINNEIFFKRGQIAEDIPWFINLLEKSKKCLFINEYIYAYRQNVSGSITASAGESSFNSLFDILETEVENINSRAFSKESKHALYSFLAYEFCILLATFDCIPKKKRQELLKYKWLLNYDINPKVHNANLVYKYFGIKATEWVLKIYWKTKTSN